MRGSRTSPRIPFVISEERSRCRCPSRVFSKAASVCCCRFLCHPEHLKCGLHLIPRCFRSDAPRLCLTADGGVSVFLGAPRLSLRTSDDFKPIPRQRRANESGEAFENPLPRGLDGSVGALPVAISDRSTARCFVHVVCNYCESLSH